MKIIEKTPFQTEKGELSLMDRLQGMMKYGLSWPAELDAQKIVIDQLNRVFEKGAVLIHNLTLPGVEIIEPIILITQGGIYTIYVTQARGNYEAKGDQWNIDNNGKPQPAQPNLMRVIDKLARVLDRYIQNQGIKFPVQVQVEPILIAADPGMHIESTRPLVRTVQSDAIKQFATSLLQMRPVFSTEYIYDLADRIVTPRPKSEPPLQPASPPPAPTAAPTPISNEPAARAHAIFNSPEQAAPFDTSDLGFAFQDEPVGQSQAAIPQNLRETSPARPLPPPKPKSRGLSPIQWAFIAFIVLIECCLVAVFGYLIFFMK